MHILTIASILPVPGIYPENDAIFRLCAHYRKTYPDDKIAFWRPSAYSNAMLAKINPKWNTFHRIIKQKEYEYEDFNVKILPFLDKKAGPSTLVTLAKTLWFFNKKTIIRQIEEFKPDVIHAHWLYPDGWLANKIHYEFGIPYILTLRRETEFFENDKTKYQALSIAEDATKVTVLNIRMKKKLKKTGYSGESELIPHGIEDMFFKYEATPGQKRANGPAILTISRFLDWKYLDRLLYALAQLAQKYSFTYTLIGQGPEEENLRSLIKQLSIEYLVKVKKPVHYEEIPAILEQYDIFALTSYPETFGRVYFEAMAVGLPIICSKNSGVDGFFKQGDAGFFVEHDSVRQIIDALEELIQSPEIRQKQGNKGKKIVKSYQWKVIAQKFNNLYHSSKNT